MSTDSILGVIGNTPLIRLKGKNIFVFDYLLLNSSVLFLPD
jgi:hypothetical protein